MYLEWLVFRQIDEEPANTDFEEKNGGKQRYFYSYIPYTKGVLGVR